MTSVRSIDGLIAELQALGEISEAEENGRRQLWLEMRDTLRGSIEEERTRAG